MVLLMSMPLRERRGSSTSGLSTKTNQTAGSSPLDKYVITRVVTVAEARPRARGPPPETGKRSDHPALFVEGQKVMDWRGALNELDDNQRTRNLLLRGLRCPGERGFALLTRRWAAFQHITASPP